MTTTTDARSGAQRHMEHRRTDAASRPRGRREQLDLILDRHHLVDTQFPQRFVRGSRLRHPDRSIVRRRRARRHRAPAAVFDSSTGHRGAGPSGPVGSSSATTPIDRRPHERSSARYRRGDRPRQSSARRPMVTGDPTRTSRSVSGAGPVLRSITGNEVGGRDLGRCRAKTVVAVPTAPPTTTRGGRRGGMPASRRA